MVTGADDGAEKSDEPTAVMVGIFVCVRERG